VGEGKEEEATSELIMLKSKYPSSATLAVLSKSSQESLYPCTRTLYARDQRFTGWRCCECAIWLDTSLERAAAAIPYDPRTHRNI
jgi:hypothetical protein